MKLILILATILGTMSAQAVETRCGWIDNPTPANWWLTDADGTWTISVQGGYSISDKSWDNMTKAISGQFEAYNGKNYGRYCGCIVGTFSTENDVLTVQSSSAKPLSACKNDKKIKQ